MLWQLRSQLAALNFRFRLLSQRVSPNARTTSMRTELFSLQVRAALRGKLPVVLPARCRSPWLVCGCASPGKVCFGGACSLFCRLAVSWLGVSSRRLRARTTLFASHLLLLQGYRWVHPPHRVNVSSASAGSSRPLRFFARKATLFFSTPRTWVV